MKTNWARILSLFLFFNGLLIAKPVPTKMSIFSSNVASMSLMIAFLRGADVYICEPGERKQLSPQSGLVALKVTKVVRGSKRKSITLPYGIRESSAAVNSGYWIWPNLNQLDGKKLLCVVVPDAEDPFAGRHESTTDAASSVTIVEGAEDPAVKEMAAICEIFDATASDQMIGVLERGRRDSRREVRKFALKWGLRALMNSPEISFGVLREQADSVKTKEDLEDILDLARFASGLISWVEPDENPEKYMYQCLMILAKSRNDEVRLEALLGFLHGVSIVKTAGRKYSLANNLSREDCNELARLIGAEKAKQKELSRNLRGSFLTTHKDILSKLALIEAHLAGKE